MSLADECADTQDQILAVVRKAVKRTIAAEHARQSVLNDAYQEAILDLLEAIVEHEPDRARELGDQIFMRIGTASDQAKLTATLEALYGS